jgi:hypothetical protein
VSAGALPTEATDRHQVAAEAEAILHRVRHTVYTHDTDVDVATGTYNMDCSAYVGYVLQAIAPQHYDTIHNGGGAHGPLAVDFYHRFHALPPGGADGWRPVHPLADARRGDIVAWDYPMVKPGDNTGHVFIIVADPQVLDDGVVAVPVYDSSDVIHYDDTRGHGGDSPATGLGSGTIHFRYTSSGIQFKFGPGDPYYDAPVAIGRLEPVATSGPVEPPATGPQQSPDDTLYNLLPAIYRMRDAPPGYPLRTLLRAIAGQVEQFAADIGHLYDNWFIETCDDDLVPYFAELVGLSLGPSRPASADASNGADASWRRAQVADAIADRSRQGSFSVLEQLAIQATGWPARAIELRRTALATQSARMPDIGRRRLIDLADADALDLLTTPLTDAAPLTDVRRLSSHRTPGTVDPSAVAVWLWRLVAEKVSRAPAATAGEENRYTFDQLGRDLALVVIPASDSTAAPSTELDVAGPITRRALRLRLEDYYGPARSICVYRDGTPVPRSEILVADLSGWHERTPGSWVSIDPHLGRIAFPARHPPAEEISVTCAHLGIGAIGGGSYQRPLPAPTAPVYPVGPDGHASIRLALDAWRAANEQGHVPSAVIEISGDGVYREHLDINLAAGEHLEIRAGQGYRPVIIPVETGGGRPDRFRVRGAGDPGAGQPPSFTLDGVWVARHSLDLYGSFAGVTLRHCTLVPAGGLGGTGPYEQRRRPSLVVHAMPGPITISSSVIGTIRVESPETGFEPLPLNVCDSVLDASDLRERAVLGTDDRPAWVRLSLSRVTVLGGAEVHSTGLVEDSIITGALECERRQTGSVRFCYVGPGSHTPKRTSCQPDAALARAEPEIAEPEIAEPEIAEPETAEPEMARGRPAARDRGRLEALIAARLVPRFDSVQFGQPAYARLATDAAPELTHGAHDEGELGAYHDLWQPLRAADLQTQLRQYVPPGIDIDIRFAT